MEELIGGANDGIGKPYGKGGIGPLGMTDPFGEPYETGEVKRPGGTV